MFYLWWDTPSENTGLWQLPKVYSAFKSALKSAFKLFLFLTILLKERREKEDLSHLYFGYWVYVSILNSIEVFQSQGP